ncbi:MAG: hypothetical protein ACJ757_04870 [Gaiellaceae bacterium]
MSSKPQYTKAGAMNFAEVGRKIRVSRQRLTDSDELGDSVRAWKIWAACSELTASWSKGSDRVHVRTIANLAGLRADKVSPILYKFAEQGIFGWVKDQGKRSPGILSLPSLAEPEPESVGAPKVKLAPKAATVCTRCDEPNSNVVPGTALCEVHYAEWSGHRS